MIRIAIQKSGRLYEDSAGLLRDAGVRFGNSPHRLRTMADNFPMEIIFVRDDDIPAYVEDGVVDIGIVGENVILEKQKSVQIIERLGFGKCRLSIAMARNEKYDGVQSLEGKKIATSYKRILGDYLIQNGVNRPCCP